MQSLLPKSTIERTPNHHIRHLAMAQTKNTAQNSRKCATSTGPAHVDQCSKYLGAIRAMCNRA